MIESLGSFGTAIAFTVLALSIVAAAVLVADFVARRTGKLWLGVILCAAVFVILGMAFGPALRALHELGCRGPGYEACMAPN